MDIKRLFFIYVFSVGVFHSASSQCMISQNSAGIGTNDNSIGAVSWGSLGNVTASDNNYATAGLLVLGTNTNYLVASGFNFSLPNDAFICGVSVSVERARSGLGTISDNAVYLQRTGTLVGSNHATGGSWSTGDQAVGYGGENDLWDETWTASDINSSDFGIAISASLSLIGVLTTARIDHISISVHYSVTLPVKLSSFTATRTEKDSVQLEWHTATEVAQSLFQVERSDNGSDWNIRYSTPSSGNHPAGQTYRYLDTNNSSSESYYRLSYIDLDGDLEWTPIVTVHPYFDNLVTNFRLFPNPATDHIEIISLSKNESAFYISDLQGMIMKEGSILSGVAQVNVNDLPPGMYQISVHGKHDFANRRFIKQ